MSSLAGAGCRWRNKQRVASCDCCCGLQSLGSFISYADSLFNIKCHVTDVLIRDLIFKICSATISNGIYKQQKNRFQICFLKALITVK